MRSHKKRRRLTLEEKIKKELYRLPKWRRKYLFENEAQERYLIENMKYSVVDAMNNQRKVDIYKAFFQQSSQGVRVRREGTLRDIFKAFRTQEPSLYAKYNSYMYRHGYSASQYFYDPSHADIQDKDYITVVTINLPEGIKSNTNYMQLTIEFNWQEEMITFGDMY